MKMRDLETRTGVNRETIRVYLREGLLPEPERPKRNVADYNDDHVRAIHAVRQLQRDSGMTLQEISKLMNGAPAPRPLAAGVFAHLEELVATRVGYERGLVSLNRLAETNAFAERDARAMADVGLIDLIDGPDGCQLSPTDAGLIETWARMRRAGFGEHSGFAPGILDYYRTAAELVADNEARLFLERVEGVLGEDEAAAMLQVALPTMLDFFGMLRLKAFLRNIRDRTQPGRVLNGKTTITE